MKHNPPPLVQSRKFKMSQPCYRSHFCMTSKVNVGRVSAEGTTEYLFKELPKRWITSSICLLPPPWALLSGQGAEPFWASWPSSGPSWFQVSPCGFPSPPGGMHPEAADSTCPHLIPCRHPAGDQGVPAVRDGGARGWSYHYALSDQ